MRKAAPAIPIQDLRCVEWLFDAAYWDSGYALDNRSFWPVLTDKERRRTRWARGALLREGGTATAGINGRDASAASYHEHERISSVIPIHIRAAIPNALRTTPPGCVSRSAPSCAWLPGALGNQ